MLVLTASGAWDIEDTLLDLLEQGLGGDEVAVYRGEPAEDADLTAAVWLTGSIDEYRWRELGANRTNQRLEFTLRIRAFVYREAETQQEAQRDARARCRSIVASIQQDIVGANPTLNGTCDAAHVSRVELSNLAGRSGWSTAADISVTGTNHPTHV